MVRGGNVYNMAGKSTFLGGKRKDNLHLYAFSSHFQIASRCHFCVVEVSIVGGGVM